MGDWTGGLLAILAATLIGVGVPGALYQALYKPKVAERKAEQRRLENLKTDDAITMQRELEVKGHEEEEKVMAERVAEMSKRYSEPVEDLWDVPALRRDLTQLAQDHGLQIVEVFGQQRPEMITPSQSRVTFKYGLRATKLRLEALATFHDFARFLRTVEELANAVVIPERLQMVGDQTGGREHRFMLEFYALERRDVDTLGR
jgi:Tfp pilus assembly protein PilO